MHPRLRPAGRLLAPFAVLGSILALAPTVRADDAVALPAPTAASILFGWQFDPSVWVPAIGAIALWLAAVRAANAAHPRSRILARRTACWVAGVATIVVALDSGIAAYDGVLFSVHMVQHLLLTLVAPPLLLAAEPVTLALQALSPRARRRWLLPLLHSRLVRGLSHPVVAWVLFAAALWGSHFSGVFEASLENDAIHRAEHAVYLATALLFWWPVIGNGGAPWRLAFPARALYVGLQMPQMSFLAVSIAMAPAPLYPHYIAAAQAWAPAPLADQQLAGGIMWVGGDVIMLGALLVLVGLWMRDEERRALRAERERLPVGSAVEAGAQASGGTGAAR